ncbi:related to thymidylate kinase [Ramularia collo-cygni]|uniref:Thymidylate kinase n=1 Tax=Ramularia collo-cygni TaxID=112498 RepID=A0A2D3UUS0_9PEZI|nr:related to thymidylate kinase [Ramularia collo-cygni]CZT21392.1 related to thymidylate kinase [Ramularia collo-cygni]
MAQRGHLIVFEGLDRSGKSTQCTRLVEHLRSQGKDVFHQRFPDRNTVIGQMINGYLSGATQQEDHAIHLLFSANRWEAAESIRKHIEAGTTVVVDRYYYSGCVYSAAKQNPTMDLAWCRHPEIGLPRPDLCIFLDISAEGAANRGGFGTERYEKQEMQDRVRELFKEMRTHQDEGEDIVVVDAGGNVAEVEEAIHGVIQQRLDGVGAQSRTLRTIQPW